MEDKTHVVVKEKSFIREQREKEEEEEEDAEGDEGLEAEDTRKYAEEHEE